MWGRENWNVVLLRKVSKKDAQRRAPKKRIAQREVISYGGETKEKRTDNLGGGCERQERGISRLSGKLVGGKSGTIGAKKTRKQRTNQNQRRRLDTTPVSGTTKKKSFFPEENTQGKSEGPGGGNASGGTGRTLNRGRL